MNLKDYENEQRKNINGRVRKVKRVIDEALRQAILIAVSTDYDGEGDFFFDSYPTASSRMDDLQKDLANMLTSNIKSGDNAAAKISAKKMESILEWAREKSGRKLRNNAAGKAISRNISEGLSNRVWNLTEQLKQEMELSMEAGMEKGMSANELSRKVRGYLNDPDKLFRRVRDKSGVLRLSKAAKAYHPGRGVYRSSYKNAMRMTVTEINSAYREADHERWKETSFILGIEIKITNGRHEPDICDDLKGRYPKDFKFTGWHPWCRCYAVPILPSVEEFKNWDGKSGFGEVEYDGVEKLQKWAKENAVRIEKAKTMPAFLKDNEKFWKRNSEPLSKADKDRRAANHKEYERLSKDKNYKDVAYDEKSGGVKATHVGHNFDKSSKDTQNI